MNMNNNTPKIMKKLIFLLLALPMLTLTATAAQVPFSCGEGNEFTIRIPVKTRGMSVEYVWYRNDTVVETAPLTAVVTSISYTVPAEKAFGSNVAYHFTYRMDCDEEWLLSPRYVVSFLAGPPPQVGAIMGDTVVCTGTAAYSTTYIPGVYYMWSVPAGWTVTAGQNTSSITVKAGTANGYVVIVPANSNGVGDTRTLAVTTAHISALGTLSVAPYICSGGGSNAGTVSLSAHSCSGGISNAGTIKLEK